MKPGKIVVTGALGHIGSLLIRELPIAFPEAEIKIIDNLSAQRYCSLFNLPAKGAYRFIEDDILKYDLRSLFQGADVVIHLAAITNAAGSFEVQEQVEMVNYRGTERVAGACLDASCPLIFISTTSVYGVQAEVVDENCPVSYLKPQSPYADSKLKAEQMLAGLRKSDGLSFTTCRFGTIYGVSPGIRFHTAVNKFCWQAVMGQPLTVWETAYNQQRPYLDLTDAIRAIVFIIRNRLFQGEIFNVLTLNATVAEILEIIRESKPDIEIQFVNAKIMNQLSYVVSNEKFKSVGFEFRGDIRTGIQKIMKLLMSANNIQ